MTKTAKITCDGCGADLTFTSNCEDYYLSLGSFSKRSLGGFVTAVAISPAITHDHHFCSLLCLDHWTDRRRHFDSLLASWWRNWKDERGSTDHNGTRSFREPGRETRESRESEFQAAALLAFPLERPNGNLS